jgi:hypothetical protein
MIMQLIRLAIGVSLVAASVLGSARAQSPAELSQVSGQEVLTNRFESPVSETDRLSDRQQLNAYFFAQSHDRLRWPVSSPPAEKEPAHPRQNADGRNLRLAGGRSGGPMSKAAIMKKHADPAWNVSIAASYESRPHSDHWDLAQAEMKGMRLPQLA